MLAMLAPTSTRCRCTAPAGRGHTYAATDLARAALRSTPAQTLRSLREARRDPRLIQVLDAGFAAPASWPLIGREHELTRIAGARAEGAPAVAICAEAGIGKTHLARHALQQAGHAGTFDVWVHGTRSSTSIPLAAFGGLVPPGTRLENEAGFIQVLVNALHEQAAGRDIVVGVDDAQLLDPASATFLLHIAEHAVAFVIATIRSGDPCPDAGIDDTAIELTPREAQMVELAARGLTNTEIADRLVLSRRTVETHIYRNAQAGNQ
jgi:Bacterial regulatory proteins, luxR family/AAA domain